ncbi:peptidoglycan recognition protein-like [Mizuhopecten yessoensis]|uniref:Peptidoglycan recognition protein 1 n=1 Tax=Mizuhopecten yessoensis TaxID=6573 RepID=A0A210QZJ4_MIZYE|nr:peptidoglycan recognition protein-like [Mizuhopecten yessoensis]OWF54189.1 Peptidoglycan recognition protein 1 [Mizuhopecten yessoensis]
MDGIQHPFNVLLLCGILGLVTCQGDIKDFAVCEGFGCEDPITSEFMHSYSTTENQADESGWDHTVNCSDLSYASKAQWGGKTTAKYENMKKKVSIVFIHHTVLSHCSTGPDCVHAVKKVDELHRGSFGWDDIGYSFLAGEDGRIYQARGWDRVGAHTIGFNKIAISICAMGNFMLQAPDQKLLDAIQSHLDCGVVSGKLEPDYKLYGHRDAIDTESLGDFLYDIIKTWPHFDRDTPRKIKPPIL